MKTTDIINILKESMPSKLQIPLDESDITIYSNDDVNYRLTYTVPNSHVILDVTIDQVINSNEIFVWGLEQSFHEVNQDNLNIAIDEMVSYLNALMYFKAFRSHQLIFEGTDLKIPELTDELLNTWIKEGSSHDDFVENSIDQVHIRSTYQASEKIYIKDIDGVFKHVDAIIKIETMPIIDQILYKSSKIVYELSNQRPILYASKAVSYWLKNGIDAQDIDLLVDFKNHKKDKYIHAFKKHGFKYIEKEVLCFSYHGIEVELADLRDWKRMCKLDLRESDMPTNLYHQILSKIDLIKLYTYLLFLEDRPAIKKIKDQNILNLLNHHKNN